MKKMNNKGFSLVELIIVVAIMAVLVGVLAPQYIKYLDKSKVGADKQLADNLRQAITTTLADPDITDGLNASKALPKTDVEMVDPGTVKFWVEVYDIMGVKSVSELKGKIKLEPDNVSIKYSVDTAKNVKVSVTYATATNTKYNFDVE
jgi:prepilin-type N-terminal cleavage/methylation domain-containing protein